MIKQTRELIQLAKSDNGMVLINWLEDQIKELSDITKMTEKEFGAKKEAVKILKELFGFLNKARENEPAVKKTNYL